MNAFFLVCLAALIFCLPVAAQKRNQAAPQKPTANSVAMDSVFFGALKYRSVGPTRGGRVTAVAGVPSQLFTFYMGSTGGGVWRTTDAGNTWENISDGQIKAGSIGAIEVAPSDPNVIYVGTGSAAPRGNVSPGIGVYKSTNAGKTWQHIGLPKAGQIGKIIVHPQSPEVVYVAALGNIFGPNPERGVFRSLDGGKTWKKTLFVSDSTGIVDLAMHPTNPRILFAAAWRAERKPWTLVDGGPEGGIYRSDDAGETWTKLTEDLPTGMLGKIGLAISPAEPDRIWALINSPEPEKAGLYRSDNGGENWEMINDHNGLRQRAWYYSHLTADPKNANILYICNVEFYKSVDGGLKFQEIDVPHGDNHGLWINPQHPEVMIECNDGGATVTLNGGKTWSSLLNQPTSELYRVTVDNQFPYRLYAGQQDNTTVSVPSQWLPSITDTEHWFAVGGSESADVAVDPRNPNIVYATSYSGEITYLNRQTGQERQVTAYPHYTEGTRQADLKYRWQWNFPVLVSQHRPDEVYQASNYVHRSTDQGQTWAIISPDLTTRKAANLGIPGGPVQHDATGVEVYSSIFALEESPHAAGELWAGTDDGLLHLTRDGGKTWANITPPQMPTEGTVNKIELSSHAPGRALLAVQRYRLNDFRPYIFLTNDYGANWRLLTTGANGIPADHFVRAIAEDPDRKGLLYAGTEFGMYVSFDEGARWQSFQLNLPHTPITDMEVVHKDLVISTQGRSFWVLDNLSVLHQLAENQPKNQVKLFDPRPTYRTNVGGWNGMSASIQFYLPAAPTEPEVLTVKIADAAGNVVRVYSTSPQKDSKEVKLRVGKGMNSLHWDLRHEGPVIVEDFVSMIYTKNAPGPKVVPGTYRATLSLGSVQQSVNLTVLPDPRWKDIGMADYQAQLDLALKIKELITNSQREIQSIRLLREQATRLGDLAEQAGKGTTIKEAAAQLSAKLTEVEHALFQPLVKVSQDEINYPRKFTNHITRLYQVVIDDHHRPTGGALERWADLQAEYQQCTAPMKAIREQDIPAFNKLLQDQQLTGLIAPQFGGTD